MYSLYYHKNKTNNKLYFGITCKKPEIRWVIARKEEIWAI